jgi:hypothetical protein
MPDPKQANITVQRQEADATARGFQSHKALEMAKSKGAEDDAEDGEPIEGLVDAGEAARPPDPEKVAKRAQDLNRMVRVRARAFIPPFRMGPRTYSLPANKEVIIPQYVKIHLEEKGLL